VSEYPIGYEYLPGERISMAWAGQMVPVPPKWVMDRTDVPDRMKYACLSEDLAGTYPAEVRPLLVEYVKSWPLVRSSGVDMLITGRVPNKRRSWAGSAVVNEIVMRYSNVMGISVAWFSMRGLHWLMDARHKGSDAYNAMRNRILNSGLLLVEDLLALQPQSPNRWFMEALYQHRFDNMLPTITTLNTEIEGNDWSHVQRIVGPTMTEYLSTNYEQFLVQFPSARVD
jgi:hypothetical protein